MAEEHGTWGSFLLVAMFECLYVSEYWELERARVDYIALKYYTNGLINEKRGLKDVRWILVGKGIQSHSSCCGRGFLSWC